MIPRRALAACLLAAAGCGPAPPGHGKALLGALLLDGSGGPPLSNAVVLVEGGRIQAAGPLSAVPIPDEADKLDGSGKVIVPALVDVCDRRDPPALVRAASPEEARRQAEALAARKPGVLYLAETSPEAAGAALEAARAAGIPVLAFATTQSAARFLVDGGASGLIGMIRDTQDLDPALVVRLRDLRIVVAPALAASGDALVVAQRNTLRLYRAGVSIAAASQGAGMQRELELLAAAGIPPLDVLVAATRNGALALHDAERGTIAPGKRADLLVLDANPGADISNLLRVSMRMTGGEWR
jgi:imidazolonepropionase-like amidohydrolase